MENRTCLWCDNDISTHRITRFYCSDRCKLLAFTYKSEKVRFVLKAKDNKPCTDCGVSYPYYVMQFDHVPERGIKCFGLTVELKTTMRSMDEIVAEMSKCDLVCANCHAERTHQRRTHSVRR